MDAATLYTVISVASGPKRVTTQKYPTMEVCEQIANELRKKMSLKTSIYCVKRKPDSAERAAAAAATAAARKRAAAAKRSASGGQTQQVQAQQPPPIGPPRDFYSGTTAPLQ
jgi:septal ring factor EnvC (AmiA/AmiB activator)